MNVGVGERCYPHLNTCLQTNISIGIPIGKVYSHDKINLVVKLKYCYFINIQEAKLLAKQLCFEALVEDAVMLWY